MSKKRLEEIGSSYYQKFTCLGNLVQNIWNKVKKEKSSKIEPTKKLSTFVYCLTAIAKVKFLEGRLGTRLHQNLRFS